MCDLGIAAMGSRALAAAVLPSAVLLAACVHAASALQGPPSSAQTVSGENGGQQLWEGAAGPKYFSGDSVLSLSLLTAYPGAVCNDGSPAGYYYRAGSDPNEFILYLEGGAGAERALPPSQVAEGGYTFRTAF